LAQNVSDKSVILEIIESTLLSVGLIYILDGRNVCIYIYITFIIQFCAYVPLKDDPTLVTGCTFLMYAYDRLL